MVQRSTPDQTALAVEGIVQSLRQAITSGQLREGDKLPSEHELCVENGVKRHTARLAISTLVRDGLVERQPGRGSYVTKRSFTGEDRKRTGIIVLLVEDYFLDGVRHDGWPYNVVLRESRRILRKHGYRLVLETIQKEDLHGALLARTVDPNYADGILMCCVAPAVQHFLARSSIPCVMMGQIADNVRIPYCSGDNFGIGYEPTRYLLQRGHRSIAIVGPDKKIAGWQLRYQGYAMAYREKRISIVRSLQLAVASDADLEQCAKTIMACACTAVQVADDSLLTRLTDRMNSRYPGSIDQIEWVVLERDVNHLEDLPRVSASVSDMAMGPRLALEKLFRMLEGKPVEHQTVLPSEFRPVASPDIGATDVGA